MLLRLFDDSPAALRAKAGVVSAVLVAANAAAWLWAWTAFAGRPALLGTAFLAWLFGLRHAFDADHIAAIDNAVRKLMQQGQAPFAAGFFFSLGHSTIVVLASLAIAATAVAAQGSLAAIHEWGGLIGTAISAAFLLLIGVANLFVLRAIWTAFLTVRRGRRMSDGDLDAVLSGGGLFARLFRPLFRVVTRSWHLYPIGFLFGLGFDTATEIGVLGISAIQAAQGLSIWSILVFPALFTAGMSLLDTADSMLMVRAYGWAFVHPLRKLWYNLTITAASVVVALFIGGMEALGLIAGRLQLEGWFWVSVEALNENLTNFGFVVVGIFAVSWIVSSVVYRAKGYNRLQVERP
ncbi:MAG: HoxN/HupN/NixA family nickel/cobalt transporter [Proteobacteria bacterium]|nr:HoxN/HupN/NixA family nickel/cobalt transporter [Pseudomonadota bacterium]